MPFPIVFGIPQGTSEELLLQMRRDIVQVVSQTMNCPRGYVHPFFPKDLLPDPETEEDGGNTIFVCLNTAMFSSLRQDQITMPKATVEELTKIVWSAFNGGYEVETMVNELHEHWKFVMPAIEVVE